MMQITVEIPDHLAPHFQARWHDIPRHLFEYLEAIRKHLPWQKAGLLDS
jgi:hypothetical protein